VFEGNTAAGVEYRIGHNSTELESAAVHSVSATREVLMAAGAAKTPQILMYSGTNNNNTHNNHHLLQCH